MNENIKLVLVEPLYQINLGYVARAAANFGVDKLYLVNPRCKYNGKEAVKYSKHAVSLLKSAKIYKSVQESVKDCDVIAGTTGIWHKSGESFFNVFTPKRASGFIKRGKKTALLIGRDDTGLTKDELKMCDFTIHVQTDARYPILNISHALAILLYETAASSNAKQSSLERFYADKKSIENVERLFWILVKDNNQIRNKKAVLFAFRHMIRRANPTRKELSAIAIALSNKRKRE